MTERDYIVVSALTNVRNIKQLLGNIPRSGLWATLMGEDTIIQANRLVDQWEDRLQREVKVR